LRGPRWWRRCRWRRWWRGFTGRGHVGLRLANLDRLLPQHIRLLQQLALRRHVRGQVGLDAQEDVLVSQRFDVVGVDRKRLVFQRDPLARQREDLIGVQGRLAGLVPQVDRLLVIRQRRHPIAARCLCIARRRFRLRAWFGIEREGLRRTPRAGAQNDDQENGTDGDAQRRHLSLL
jgi:hypothetical protein